MTRAAFEQILERLEANPVLPSFALMHELGHAQLRLWRQIGGKAAKPIKQSRKRKPTLASVARQTTKANISVAAYEFRPDGTIVAVVGKPNAVLDEADDVKSNSRSSTAIATHATARCGTNSVARTVVGSC
jgi:hypothetical protein